MIDWQVQLYDPAFTTLGTEARLASGSTFTVIDRTAGVNVPDGRTQVDTVRPACDVRAAELAASAITVSDLPEDQITFNGQTWRIKSYIPLPSPAGESDGLVRLILLFEP